MRQDSANGPGASRPSNNRHRPAPASQPQGSLACSRLARPAAHEVFGHFLRTLEKLDRDASRQARETGDAT